MARSETRYCCLDPGHSRAGALESLRPASAVLLAWPTAAWPFRPYMLQANQPPGALNDCFKAGAGRKTTSEANDRNRFEIPSLRGLDFARPVYFPFFQLEWPCAFMCTI